MKDYEEAVLIALFDEGVIGSNYKPIEKAARKIKWAEIARKYGTKKSCELLLAIAGSFLLQPLNLRR